MIISKVSTFGKIPAANVDDFAMFGDVVHHEKNVVLWPLCCFLIELDRLCRRA